jgi:toxin ParE1/3/4
MRSDDLTDILQYTLSTGEDQLLAYRDVIDNTLRFILDNPLAGFTRPAVSERHRFVVAGQHLIAYRVTETAIEVSRILHGRMDIANALPGE